MHNTFFDFKKDESGAVTSEWVLLLTGIVAIAFAVVVVVSDGVERAAVRVNDGLQVEGVIGSIFGGDDSDDDDSGDDDSDDNDDDSDDDDDDDDDDDGSDSDDDDDSDSDNDDDSDDNDDDSDDDDD